MRRQLAAFALIVAFATGLQAQGYIYPGWGGVVYPPQQPGIQYLGQLPNGIHVFNPWNMYQNLNNQRPIYYYQPYFNPYLSAYNSYYNNPYGGSPGYNPAPIIQREAGAGRFIPAGPDLAINPITGTRLAPYRGVALTNDGAFYRTPGSGSYTAWGAFIPGSGTYVNPLTGDIYQPGSGIIIRR